MKGPVNEPVNEVDTVSVEGDNLRVSLDASWQQT
jgi:hypothetical protein